MDTISNNIEKLEALQEGLQLSLNEKFTRLIIEGDSQIVINAITKCQTPNWVLNSKLEKVLGPIDELEGTRFQHIYCEGNTKADELANKGVESEDFTFLLSILIKFFQATFLYNFF